MNERIRKLYEESKETRNTERGGNVPVTCVNFNTFAELIIRECSKTLRESKYKLAETDYYDGFNEGLEYSANRIEELFGVE